MDEHNFQVFDSECQQCDAVLGADFMHKIGLNLLHDKSELEWLGNTIPVEMLNRPETVVAHVDACLFQLEMEDLGMEPDSCLVTPIMDTKHKKADLSAVVEENYGYLTAQQQEELEALLQKHEKLFDGCLYRHPGKLMHIELEEGVQSICR